MAATLKSSLRSERQVSQAHASSSSSSSRTIGGQVHSSARPKLPVSAARRSVTPSSRTPQDSEHGRVRVSVRVRPKNQEELLLDADFSDCIELQPELKRLRLKRNNWSFDSYKFDEILTEGASQKRVYEVVAKPVIEGVLNGCNGTVLAYGQTGTGKTYTVGNLGKDDASERGLTVRALEDIISNASTHDSVEISYLQLYMECFQDLLEPQKTNIPIVEDPRNGEVSLPGATVIKVQDIGHFLQLLQMGEANRHVANTNSNTSSSRSHAILMVHLRRSIRNSMENEIPSHVKDTRREFCGVDSIPIVQRTKLLIVDLAGSERLDKSGSKGQLLDEAKFINLSLTSLGKCINALAENSAHIPTRESKLTRLLRDSFGGSARTSLVVTIGPSAQHLAETASTIMFGQRAMKIENMIKLREEFDYESLCRKLENQVDQLSVEIERQQKLRENDRDKMEKKLRECQNSLIQAEKDLLARSEVLDKENARLELEVKDILNRLNSQIEQKNLISNEAAHLEISLKQCEMENSKYRKALAETTQTYEKKIADMNMCIVEEHGCLSQRQKETDELIMKLQGECWMHENTLKEREFLKSEKQDLLSENDMLKEELHAIRQKLFVEEKLRKSAENELVRIKRFLNENKERKMSLKENIETESSASRIPFGLHNLNQSREISAQSATIAKICEEVGLQNILALLTSEDLDSQTQAVRVVANLAAEDINQEKIAEEGGIDALLKLLRSSHDETILRVASGAIANLAMNVVNQSSIVSKGGSQLLANIATKTDDPQTLRMIAGAIANLCGNVKLHNRLIEDGGIKALLGMVRSGNADVTAQVARGMANFAKCESRSIAQGHRKSRSLLMEGGVLKWLVANSTATSSSIRRHIELALCHLAQNEENAGDFISSGAVEEVVRIWRESSRDDIRNLAKKSLKLNPAFQAGMDQN